MKAAVLGSPIVHSLSPYLHRAAHRAMGLHEWHYEAIECDEAALPGLIGDLDGTWRGLSLTMPLKRAVLPLLDTVSELALQVGVANTVILSEEGLHGDNTDVHGIVEALAEAGVTAPRAATILGGGATAASALAALRRLGLGEATLVVRDPARVTVTAEAAERLGVNLTVQSLDKLEAALEVDLVVSTMPSGAADDLAETLAGVPALFDVIYAPWPTRPAAAVAARGGTVVGGFPMLLHQAVRQVELMTGRADVPVEVMREAGKAEIVRRAAPTE
ncbi:shikimate dehydrogenase [Streptosporangium sp. NPDC023615]|uniref:shikimate dehydrogenase n=1 Tax=Streptosporangium sp. NPDC023615 TaxID=3154794 RepID=UPI003440AA96